MKWHEMNRIYLVFSFLCIFKLCDCQTQWVRCPDNLVMMKNNDFFEGVAIGSPSVIYDSDTLKML